MFEVEVKVVLLSPASLRRRLESVDAHHAGEGAQTDTFYSDPGQQIVRRGEALRVREADGSWVLTYKGPAAAGPVKRRTEHEVACDDDPGPVLEALGYRPTVRLTKHREAWDAGGLAVCIDTIEGLGAFAEIEVITEDPDAAEARIEEALVRLGLGGADRVEQPYVELALAAGLAETL